MWEGNFPRQHDVKKVLSRGNSGTVDKNLPKEHVVLNRAGRMTLHDSGRVLRVKDYQVCVVRS